MAMSSTKSRLLKEGDVIPNDRDFILIDTDESHLWFCSRCGSIITTFRYFEIKEEAVIFVESLGKDYGIAEFWVNMDWLEHTRVVKMLHRKVDVVK